jgi:hypothetical protein
MKTFQKLSLIFLSLAFINISCTKKSMNSSYMKVGYTNTINPSTPYDHIYIDLKQISIHYDGSHEDTWMDLPTNSGVYDLLTLTNNVTAFIADEANIPIGGISQLKIVFGNKNSIVVGGTSYVLKIPAEYNKGVKVLVEREIKRSKKLFLILNVDGDKSIETTGGGDYTFDAEITVKSANNY